MFTLRRCDDDNVEVLRRTTYLVYVFPYHGDAARQIQHSLVAQLPVDERTTLVIKIQSQSPPSGFEALTLFEASSIKLELFYMSSWH